MFVPQPCKPQSRLELEPGAGAIAIDPDSVYLNAIAGFKSATLLASTDGASPGGGVVQARQKAKFGSVDTFVVAAAADLNVRSLLIPLTDGRVALLAHAPQPRLGQSPRRRTTPFLPRTLCHHPSYRLPLLC